MTSSTVSARMMAAVVSIMARVLAVASARSDSASRAGSSTDAPPPAGAIARRAFSGRPARAGLRPPPRFGASRAVRPAGGVFGVPPAGAASFTG